MKQYEKVLHYVRKQIEQGYWHVGKVLPSLRVLSQQLQVGKNTVIRAYYQLEDEGLITARERSGFYVNALPVEKELAQLNPVPVMLGKIALNIIHAPANRDYIPLGSANPDGRFLARRKFYRLLAKHSRQQSLQPDRVSYYAASPGNQGLRQQLAIHHSPYLPTCHADDFVITSGAQEALSLALQATTQTGDTVAVESPSFYGLLQCIEALGLKVLEIPSYPHQGLDLDILEQCFEQWNVKAVMTNPNINNPQGFIMPDTHKQRLVALANQYDAAIIEDDVASELYYLGSRPLPIKAFDTQDRVLLCSSLSKTLDSSSRLGWIMAGRYHEQVNYLKYVTTMGSAAIVQVAAAEYLQSQNYERHLRTIRRTYRQRQQLLHELIARYWSSPITISHAQGGFLSWIKLPEGVEGMWLYEQARQQGISITPGSVFSTQAQFKHHIRLNYATLEDTPESHQAIKALGELIKQKAGE